MQVRAATFDDYDAFARLFPALGVDDPMPSRARFGDELVARTLVADTGSGVVGYALIEALGDTCYLRNLVTDPAHRRAGVGRALMDAVRARARRGGATAWCLNVKPGNVAAIALYERCGLRAAYRACALRIASSVVLAAPPADVALVDLPPAADPELERAFHLLAGQLASARARPTRRVVQLVRGGAVLGLGVFSSAIPGAFPFKLRDPALAAAFLAHLRALAPAGAAYVQVAVEDDPALRAAIEALGGRAHLEILHMRGPL